MSKTRRVVLAILDGFGESPDQKGNAVRLARMPSFAHLYETSPWTLIGASAGDVGLPDGQMGNSEVGHLNMGAGRIVYQDIVRIDKSIKDGDFYSNPTLTAVVDAVKASGGTLHLFGLTSPGNVHASLDHAYAICELAKRRGFTKVAWHAFLDGRDTPPKSAAGYLRQVGQKLAQIGVGELVSAVGRYYAMDRDKRWDRLEVAWKMLTRGEGQLVDDLAAAVESDYTAGAGKDGKKELTDEFVMPLLRKGADGKPRALIKDGDACFFFNFRADRARQLTLALSAGADAFPYFDRGHRPKLAAFATMTKYDAKVDVPAAFPPQSLHMILGEVLSRHGVSQLRTAETEKYAHVTYFFNGGNEQAFPGEERKLVPSNREVATYDLAPEMSAVPVTDGVVEALEPGGPTFILVNYANPDMVGHTGKLKPAVSAMETVDTCIGRIATAAAAADATLFITADHGNCEVMIDPVTGQPHTAHTMNPVPFIVVGGKPLHKLRSGGRLADVAPTILAEMGIAAPPEMDGVSLFAEAGIRREMSLGKRLIDLARSELNSLLDKAARADDDDRDLRDHGDPSSMSDAELSAEIERRRQAREEVERATHGPRPPRRPPPPRRTAAGDDAIRRAYAALEIQPGSDFEAVRHSYLRLLRKYHPDLHADTPDKQRAATDLTQRLTEAYKTLERHLRR